MVEEVQRDKGPEHRTDMTEGAGGGGREEGGMCTNIAGLQEAKWVTDISISS